MRRLILLAALIAQPVAAQVSNPPPAAAAALTPAQQMAIDKAATDAATAKTQAQTAADAAAAAKSAADTAASNLAAVQTKADTAASVAASAATVAAAACQPMAMVAPVEVPGGTAGSGSNCRLVNAANNRISRTAVFTVGAGGAILCGGSATCNWSVALPAGATSYPIFFTAIGAVGSQAVSCKVASTANTGFTGGSCRQSVASIAVLGASVDIVAPTGTQVFALSLPSTQ